MKLFIFKPFWYLFKVTMPLDHLNKDLNRNKADMGTYELITLLIS